MNKPDEMLRTIRESGDNPTLPVALGWNELYSLLPYQRVGISHLVVKTKFVLGDPCGTGKTLEELYSWKIVSATRLLRLMVLTTKSAVYQWAEEVEKFFPGTPVFVIPSVNSRGTSPATKEDRQKKFNEWVRSGSNSVVILNYSQLVNDWEQLEPNLGWWVGETQLCLDECQKIKNPESLLHKTIIKLIVKVPRVHGLTATLVKNKAHDAFSTIDALVPGYMTKDYFETRYCIWEDKWIPLPKGRGRRRIKIKQLKSYRLLEEFVNVIEPYYLARTDEQLELQRPNVVHINRKGEMCPAHRKVYAGAEKGIFTSNFEPCLIHAQLAAGTPEYFIKGSSEKIRNSKMEMLLELMDVELEGEPVVIYSPLETSISYIEKALKHLNPVRVTGVEESEERNRARRDFMEGKTNVILITDAGGEALNLQRAKHLVFYSRPWDVGRYTQIVGRIRRFGSVEKSVVIWHLTMKDSLDEFLDAVLVDKWGPFEKIVRQVNLIGSEDSFSLEVVKRMRRERLKSE